MNNKFTSESVKEVNIYLTASWLGKYPPLFISSIVIIDNFYLQATRAGIAAGIVVGIIDLEFFLCHTVSMF